MNASHSTNLLTNSCDHISTNGTAPRQSHAIPLFTQGGFPLSRKIFVGYALVFDWI